MELTDLTVKGLVAATASSEPVPGGGSISAVCGALAAALGRMVCGLTAGRKKYADVEEEIIAIAERIDSLIPFFIDTVTLDSDAYNTVFNAYKMPKDTDEEKAHRNDAIQMSLVTAAMVPLGVVDAAVKLMPLLERLAHAGNRNAITDVYVASLCARTAALGAGANVRINLLSIKDEKLVSDIRDRLEHHEQEVLAVADRIAGIVNKEMK